MTEELETPIPNFVCLRLEKVFLSSCRWLWHDQGIHTHPRSQERVYVCDMTGALIVTTLVKNITCAWCGLVWSGVVLCGVVWFGGVFVCARVYVFASMCVRVMRCAHAASALSARAGI